MDRHIKYCVDNRVCACYNIFRDLHRSRIAGIAQSVVRRIGSAEVTGPIPVASSIKTSDFIWGFCVTVCHIFVVLDVVVP